jgi:hypothetical protein
VLLLSIPTTLFAQTPLRLGGTDPASADNLRMTWYKELKMGNTMKLELYGTRTLPDRFNIDSLVHEMTLVLQSIKDSLPPEETGRKITITVYNPATREINVHGTAAADKNFIEHNSHRSLLKTVQDSIVLNLYTDNDPLSKTKIFYRLSFFLNDLFDMDQYGSTSFAAIFQHAGADDFDLWKQNGIGRSYLKADPTLQLYRSYDPAYFKKSLIANVSVSVQNYSKLIVPSVAFSVGFYTEHNFKYTSYWLSAEPHFTFIENEKGVHKSYINPFVVLSYRRYNSLRQNNNFLHNIYKNFSVGYLLSNKCDRYQPNTFKIGFTQLYLGKHSLRLEPGMYFDHFFKNPLPSLRLTQSF